MCIRDSFKTVQIPRLLYFIGKYSNSNPAATHKKSPARESAGFNLPVNLQHSPESECEGVFWHIQQGIRASQHGYGVGPGARQHAGKVETSGLHLGGVEQLFTRTFGQLVLSNFGHTGPQVSKDRVTRVHQVIPVSYTHLRAHETDSYLVC